MMKSNREIIRQKVVESHQRRDRYLEEQMDRVDQLKKKKPEVRFERAASSSGQAASSSGRGVGRVP